MRATVKLISHASLLIEVNNVVILTDPWFFGTAFNDGWSLDLAPDLETLRPLIETVDYVWISHEHPDHLHFPSLKWIAKIRQANMPTLLFQDTNEDKVFSALHRLGFESVVKLVHGSKVKLGDCIDVACYGHRHIDSALAVFVSNKFWLLNVNDCELSEGDSALIREKLGTPTVVFNQFAIAGFDGFERHCPEEASRVQKGLLAQHKWLGAEVTIPFASFMRFSKADNMFLNQYRNPPWAAKHDFVAEGARLRFLSPMGREAVWEDHDGTYRDNLDELMLVELDALRDRYKNSMSEQCDELESPVVEFSAMKEVVESRLNILKGKTSSVIWNRTGVVVVRVRDHNDAFYECDIKNAEFRPSEEVSHYHLEIYSQPLTDAFKNPFGIQTLGVSGRYRFNPDLECVPASWRWLRIISSLDNANIHFSIRSVFRSSTVKWLWQRRHGIFTQVLQQMYRFAFVRSSVAS